MEFADSYLTQREADSDQDVGHIRYLDHDFDAYEDVATVTTRLMSMTLRAETIVQTKWDDWR
jgi:hypothetical protein